MEFHCFYRIGFLAVVLGVAGVQVLAENEKVVIFSLAHSSASLPNLNRTFTPKSDMPHAHGRYNPKEN